MGFLAGSSSFQQHLLFQYNHSTSSHSTSTLLFSTPRRVVRRKGSVTASLHDEDSNNGSHLHRRALLLVGISSTPLLQLREIPAAEGAVRDRQEFLAKRVQGSQPAGSSERPQPAGSSERPRPAYTDEGPQPADSSEIPRSADSSGSSEGLSTLEHTKQVDEQGAQGNLYLSFLNAIGIVGSGVLGALYAISQKDKAALEATVESMKSLLNEKETAAALLEKNYEKRILHEQEERKKQFRKLKEVESSLSNKLATANATIAGLGQELRNEKRLFEEVRVQLDQLQSSLLLSDKEKSVLEGKIKEKMDAVEFLQDRVSLLSFEIKDKEKNVETLNSLLSEKESEVKNLNSIIDQTKADHENASSAVERLKVEVQQTREELDLKNSSIDELNGKIKSLSAEGDDTNKRIHALREDYKNLKSSSVKKAELDSKLLSKKDDELRQLEEKLGLALNEAKDCQALIVRLTKEKESVTATLEEEMNKVKNLQDELQTTQQNLGASKREVSSLSKQLEKTEKRCEELQEEVSKIQDESFEAQKLLSSSLDEVRSASKLLVDELNSVNMALDETKQELSATSNDLKVVLEANESLKKELLEIYKKAENTSLELKEEKNLVATLKRELDASVQQIKRDSEVTESLEEKLDEATKSLHEMNKSSLSLTRELEATHSRTASLEAEKDMLYKSLMEQRNITKEAQENIEDAQNLIMRLGAEREKLDKRAKKLEEELAAAKGEILRSRRQSNLSKVSLSEQQKNTNAVEATTSVATKKNGGRRKKTGPS